jgi:FkbM family methyltransferase
MNQTIADFVKKILKKLNIGIIRYNKLQKLLDNRIAVIDIELLLTLPNNQASQLLSLLRKSKSQLRQDLFVLSELDFKKNGYFIEFGATNGIDLSNTFLLEKEFGWQGILAEPAKCWHQQLKNNRNATIETNCVWSESNATLTFNEVKNAELSTVNNYSTSDFHKGKRNSGTKYDVTTISLLDLLVKYNAPKKIDFLSIDTEGSEYEILKNFDFNKYDIKIITCEHNFTPMREKVFALLSQNGYVRKYEKISRVDDWYVKA